MLQWKKTDVVAITETWSNSAHLVFELSLQGTKSFRKIGRIKREDSGGGIICNVKSTLAVIKVDKQDAENYESVYVEITHNNKNLALATVYRPPKLHSADDIALSIEIQSLIQGKNTIVIGNFNCANVDWRLLIRDQEGSWLIVMVDG